MSAVPATSAPPLDAGSREWLRVLRADGATRHEAVARLHTLLLRAGRFEAARRAACRTCGTSLRRSRMRPLATR
jgi:hypothetical protein